MQIIHIATEIAPVAKVGGLADVVYGLAQATKKLGASVEIILPKYDALFKDAKVVMSDLVSYDGPYAQKNTVWKTEIQGLSSFLIEPHHPGGFFSRGMIYGCADDVDRFIYFSRAALEYLLKSGKKPDIIHIHDWPTAAVAPLLKEMYRGLGLKAKTVFTIHNLEHQGRCSPNALSRAGLRGDDFLKPDKMQDPLHPNCLNLMKGGIEYSDFITTVSPSYEKEIKTPLGGFNLDSVIIKNQKKLKGILNGIDLAYWPLPSSGKDVSKKELQKRFNLNSSEAPLVCTISRLALQKGPYLIHHAILRTLENGGQFILLGTTTTPEIDKMFRSLQKQLSKNKNAAFHFQYDEPLSHLVYAGADMIMIPSTSEPCGLTQIIAQRYGTIPIVRKTGGLADTVFDGKNGFVFEYPDEAGVNWALDRALECFKTDPKKWQALMKTAMAMDFGWDKSAHDYFKVYQELV